MSTIQIIIISILAIFQVVFTILFIKRLRRMNAVKKFMLRNLHLAHEWNQKNIYDIIYGREPDAFDWFYKKQPDRDDLIYSNKPLTLDDNFDKKTLEKLFNELNSLNSKNIFKIGQPLYRLIV